MFTLSSAGGAGGAGGGKRGEIQIFSRQSRFRLFKLLHQLEFNRITFMTLTYPEDFPTDPKVFKAHLKEFRRRFERTWGKIKAVWRLEFQKRGAPHYHIMYLDGPFIPIANVCLMWAEVIHSEDPNHKKIGVDIKLVAGKTSQRLVASYLAKYIAKVDTRIIGKVFNKVGRWWGKWNIEEVKPTEILIMDYQAENLTKRILELRSLNSWVPNDLTLCSILGETMGGNDFRNNVLKILNSLQF